MYSITKYHPHFLSIILALVFASNAQAQLNHSPTPLYNYYYDYKLANPAFTGTYGKHVISSAYSGVSAQGQGGPDFVYASYERNIASLKLAVGGLATYDERGFSSTESTVSESAAHYGLLFNKQFSFNEKSGLYAGTQLFYQTYRTDYTYHSPGSPWIVDGFETTDRFNLDLGLVYYSPVITFGASLKGILEDDERQRNSVNLIARRELKVTDRLKAIPSVIFSSDFIDNYLDINSTFKIDDRLLLGAAYRFGVDGVNDFSCNVGFNIIGYVQVITHLYSLERDKDNLLVEAMVRVVIPKARPNNTR